MNGQLQSAKELLAFNGMAALTDAEGRTPLHYAAKYANEEFVEACCNAHAQIDAYDKAAMTPLLLAAEAGNLSLVQLLIQKGANPLLTDYRGFTLLHFATKSKNPKLVSWILDNLEINVNAKDHATHTPLYYIQENPEYDNQTTQIVTILMSKGATSQLRNTLEK